MANKAKKKPKKLSKKEAAAQAREKQAAAAARREKEARELLLREEAASREAAEEQRAQEQRARREEEEAAAKAAQAKAEQEEAQASSERAQAWWAVLGHSLDSWWFRWFAKKDPRAVQVVRRRLRALAQLEPREADSEVDHHPGPERDGVLLVEEEVGVAKVNPHAEPPVLGQGRREALLPLLPEELNRSGVHVLERPARDYCV